jgi:hypothetical protein
LKTQNPQALNRYSYVLNNPLIYTDPTGHEVTLDTEEARILIDILNYALDDLYGELETQKLLVLGLIGAALGLAGHALVGTLTAIQTAIATGALNELATNLPSVGVTSDLINTLTFMHHELDAFDREAGRDPNATITFTVEKKRNQPPIAIEKEDGSCYLCLWLWVKPEEYTMRSSWNDKYGRFQGARGRPHDMEKSSYDLFKDKMGKKP